MIDENAEKLVGIEGDAVSFGGVVSCLVLPVACACLSADADAGCFVGDEPTLFLGGSDYWESSGEPMDTSGRERLFLESLEDLLTSSFAVCSDAKIASEAIIAR